MVAEQAPHNSPLTSAQTANYRKLRNLVFAAAVVVLMFGLWRAMGTGELEHRQLKGTARLVAWTVSTLLGLGAAWLMSCGVAKSLARSIK